jgi:hypothetical protein
VQVRELLEQWPDMPATVIAERIGWTRGLTVLKEWIRELRYTARPAVRPLHNRATDGLMAGKRKTNPAGSTNSLRGDVLRVLGVLKVATADQIQRIVAPHLSFRYTDKKNSSKRKQARTASHIGLSDVRWHGPPPSRSPASISD